MMKIKSLLLTAMLVFPTLSMAGDGLTVWEKFTTGEIADDDLLGMTDVSDTADGTSKAATVEQLAAKIAETAGIGSTDAADIDVVDSSGYWTATNVETILAEIGSGWSNFLSDAPSDGTSYVRLNGSWAAVSGSFPGFTDLVSDYSFDPDTKVDVSNMTGVWADLNAVVILDSTEPADGRNLSIPLLPPDDADADLHMATVADVDYMRRPIILTKSANYTLGTDSDYECTNLVTVHVTGAATITACPYTAFVMPLTVVTRGNVAVSVKMNAADRMVLDGTALDDGDKATNTSSTGDTIYLEPESASGWFAWSGSNDGTLWTDGGQ